MSRRLVLVTGLPADRPGPTAVADLHAAVLNRAPVRTPDARPDASALAAARVRPDDVDAAAGWLAEAFADREEVVVDDARVAWLVDQWCTAAARHDAAVAVVAVARHPAAAVAEAETHDAAEAPEGLRRQRAVAAVAGWCAAALAVERASRDLPRAFVALADLQADPVAALAPVAIRLGLDPAALADVGAPAATHGTDLPELPDLPDPLREVAAGLWTCLGSLVAGEPADDVRLEELGRAYRRLHDHAVGIALDHTRARETHVRRRVRSLLREEYESQVAELEAQLDELHHDEEDPAR